MCIFEKNILSFCTISSVSLKYKIEVTISFVIQIKGEVCLLHTQRLCSFFPLQNRGCNLSAK